MVTEDEQRLNYVQKHGLMLVMNMVHSQKLDWVVRVWSGFRVVQAFTF